MGGVEEGIETTMEVDSNVTKVSIESTQVAPNTTQVVIETMHPYTLSTIVETKVPKISIEGWH
jgi:phenylpyruvate tautomerase PptA (4-oxalocrotonate tautomerase family)